MNFWQRFFMWSGVVEWIAVLVLALAILNMHLDDLEDK